MNKAYYCPYPDTGKTVTLSGDQLGFFPDDVITIEEIANNTPVDQIIGVDMVIYTEEDGAYHFGKIHKYDDEHSKTYWRHDNNGCITVVVGAFRLFRIIDIHR